MVILVIHLNFTLSEGCSSQPELQGAVQQVIGRTVWNAGRSARHYSGVVRLQVPSADFAPQSGPRDERLYRLDSYFHEQPASGGRYVLGLDTVYRDIRVHVIARSDFCRDTDWSELQFHARIRLHLKLAAAYIVAFCHV